MSDNSAVAQRSINNYRHQTYRYLDNLHLKNTSQAIEFVNQRGFIFFWPNKGIELPSLWCAVAGNRPVPNNHDDPGHITWRWKDNLLDKKCWYYARILSKRATIISLDLLPCFYALSPNFGTPEEDYLIDYQQGHLSQEEKAVYETLLDNGAMNSLALRKAAHLSFSENTSRYSRALDNLQKDFRILPAGIAEAGAWHYSYIFDTTHRMFPELIEQAGVIKQSQARYRILESYFLSVGAAQLKDMRKLFHWEKDDLQKTLHKLTQDQLIVANQTIQADQGDWFILSELLH